MKQIKRNSSIQCNNIMIKKRLIDKLDTFNWASLANLMVLVIETFIAQLVLCN